MRKIRSRTSIAGIIGAIMFFAPHVHAQATNALTQAKEALDAGDTARAITLLEDYRREHVDNAELYNLLGIAYGRANESGRSLAMFKEFARLNPRSAEASNNLGAAYLRQGDSEQAQAAFEQALRLNPQDANTLYNLGALFNAQHKYSDSRPLLDRAFVRDRTQAIAFEDAIANAGIGDRARALRILDSMAVPSGQAGVPWLKLKGALCLDAGDLAAASKALEAAAGMSPDPESLYSLSLVRLKQNKPEAAVILLDKAFESLPVSQRQMREGTLLAENGAYTQALSLFEQAARADPAPYDALYNIAVLELDNLRMPQAALDAARRASAIRSTGEIHALLGDIYEAQGLYQDALTEYQSAVRIEPENDKLVFDLGAELMLHENYDAAEKIFTSGEEKFPRSAQIRVGMGANQFLAGKTEQSVLTFLRAVDLDPQFEPAYRFLGEAFLFSTVKSPKVVEKLAAMAAREPQSFEAQYYYGAALVQQMQSEATLAEAVPALTVLRRAASLAPKDAHVYYELGEVFRIKAKYNEAVAYYQKSTVLDPNFPEPLYKLGQMFIKLGRQAEAKNAFARHHEVTARSEATLYKRSGEIRSFILKMRSVPSSDSNSAASLSLPQQ